MAFLPALIAWRYIIGAKNERNISFMALLSFVAITIATCSLTLVLCIMQGFEDATHQQLQGIHAPIIIESAGNQLQYKKIAKVLTTEFQEVAGFSPSATQQIIIQSPSNEDETMVVSIKGIDPKQEIKTSQINTKLIKSTPDYSFNELLKNNTIIIGEKLAKTFNIKKNDVISIFYKDNENNTKKGLRLLKKTARVVGIFKTGIEEFDLFLVYSSLDFFHSLFPESGISKIALKLRPEAHEQNTIKKLKNRLGIDVYSWKELYPALVSALMLEKYAMSFILSLIVLVASMSIISLLFMFIMQKNGDIAILKSMGMSKKNIKYIFSFVGIGITLISTLTGLCLAYIIGHIFKTYPFITLPDNYYVSHLPISLHYTIFLLVFILAVLLSILATWLPTRQINNLNIANILRHE